MQIIRNNEARLLSPPTFGRYAPLIYMEYFRTREDTTMPFKCNMGNLDRAIRLIISCALIYITLIDTGLIANHVIRYVLLVMGCVNIVTASVAYCPMYTLANISTKGQRST